jgi:uncharacterized protein involved in outer membrane biogenesis
MKRIAKALLWVTGLYLGLMLASGLAVKAMLSSGRIKGVLSSLNSRLPVTVSAEGGSFDLAQWFRFRPVITISGLSVYNPPGFSSRPMLGIKEVAAQVALLTIFKDNFEIIRVSLREPVVNIETNAKGNTNAGALLARLGSGGGSTGGRASIDRLSVIGGTIQYAGQAPAAGFAIRDIELSLEDFGTDKSCHLTLGARLFGGKTSRLDFQGRVGPAGSDTLPATGEISVVLAPAEIPPSLRNEYFGELLRDPASASKASFHAAMQGDLMKTLRGEGQLELANFELGQARGKRLTLRGKAPLRLAVHKALASPSLELATQNASLELGQGRWNGALETSLDGSRIQGQMGGAITGVRIEEMLSAFTSTKDAVSGVAEIPEFRLRFAGTDARQIQISLSGQGLIKLKNGRVALFDLLNTIEGSLKNVLQGVSAAPGATDFVRLSSHFEIRNSQILLPDVVLENASSAISGRGQIGFDHAMSFDLTASMTGELAARLGGRPNASGQAQLRVPVKVRGTMESPKIRPDIAGLAKSQAVERSLGLIESFLSKNKAARQPK